MSAQKKCKQIIAADHSVRCITLSESEIRGGKLEENVVCFFSEYISTSSAVARPNGQPRQAGVARGVRGHAPPPRNFEL